MLEDDYIMRLIKEMVRTILKLLFNIDMQSPIEEILEEEEKQALLQELLLLAGSGKVKEAMEKLDSSLQDGDRESLKLALVFYSKINDMNEDFLAENGCTREEIKGCLDEVLKRYGLDGMAELF